MSRKSAASLRDSSYALRVIRRPAGDTATVYRKREGADGRERWYRLTSMGPLALTAGSALLRASLRINGHGARSLAPGRMLPLDPDSGARAACYALLAAGLRDADRLARAAGHLAAADGAEAAWWLGLLLRSTDGRALRALRILTSAVK